MNRTVKWTLPSGALAAVMLLGTIPAAAETTEEAASAEAPAEETVAAEGEAKPAEEKKEGEGSATATSTPAPAAQPAGPAEGAAAAPAEAVAAQPEQPAQPVAVEATPAAAEAAPAAEAIAETVAKGAEVATEEAKAKDDSTTRGLLPYLASLLASDEAKAKEGEKTAEAASAAEEKKDEEPAKPWSVALSLRTVVGQGTFVTPANDSQWAGLVDDGGNSWDRVSMVLAVAPSYQIGDYSVGMNLSWRQWLTAGGGSNEPQELRIGDLGLDLGWKGYTVEAIGLNITPGLSFAFPTSKGSRFATLLVDTSAGVDFSRRFFERLTLTYSLSGGKSFHSYKTPTVDINEIGIENAIFRAGGAEAVTPGRFAIEGYNTEFAVTNGFSAGVKILDKLSGSLSWSLSDYWSYAYTEDRPEGLSLPDYARPGRGRSQVTSSSLGLRYGINDMLSARLSLNTVQPPKTADNKGFRFPFWNFEGAANNFSSVQLGLSATY